MKFQCDRQSDKFGDVSIHKLGRAFHRLRCGKQVAPREHNRERERGDKKVQPLAATPYAHTQSPRELNKQESINYKRQELASDAPYLNSLLVRVNIKI